MFEEAPKLRDFTCHHGDLASIVLPWAQLAHCDIGARPMAEYLAILPKLPNLVKLKIELSFHDSAVPSNETIVVLPRLTKLEIDMIPDPSALLNHLTLPSLADIRHDTRWTDPHSWFDTYSWDLSSVRSLVSRSSCCVTSLALPITLISIDEARVLFSLTPELTRLESNHYSDGNWALFERRKGTNQALLPKLKVLRMDFVRGTHVGPAFMKTIISRWALTPQEKELGAVQLERFIYVVPTRLDQGDLRGHNHRCRFLLALQAQGLDVKVLEINVDGPDDSDEEYLNYEYNYHGSDDDDHSDTDSSSYEDDTDDEHDLFD
ncbi:hypothetical protein FIBSPDRAFT_1039165 [Athelia psychrophila]|uniref:F-box domain-containing protein n=1 Tax=Athelia psychrophila TaxID=1759441 RepID=A0A166RY12_9AGAM|nr:hypothetical protein FIBSPDRAFT_1039165 [Fibularhizoctonia sp. CBS 109695]